MLGAGTRANPYIIQTPQDLNNVRNKITAGIYYELGNDIDMSSFGNFTPIGSSSTATRFKCSFDGKGYSIRNLTIISSINFTGFISTLDTTATVKNVSFTNAKVTSTGNYVGIVAGGNTGSSTNVSLISNCHTSGIVQGNISVCGIVGSAGGEVENCFSNVDVIANQNAYGIARLDSVIYAKVKTSIFNGTVSATSGENSGITGGVINSNKVLNNYYNMDTTGLSTTDDYGYGLTDSQMKDQSSFTGFDSDVWGFNGSYPYLKIFGIPPVPAQNVKVSVSSHIEYSTSYLESARRKVNVSVSTVQAIHSNAQNQRFLIKNVTSYIDEIVSNVSALQNANVKEYEIISYVNNFESNSIRLIRTIRTVESDVQPIQIVTDIEIPYKNDKPVYAIAYVIENPSSQIVLENKTSLSNYLNDTNLSTINNQTNTNEKENRTEMSVI